LPVVRLYQTVVTGAVGDGGAGVCGALLALTSAGGNELAASRSRCHWSR
jgi:hypothetical protein